MTETGAEVRNTYNSEKAASRGNEYVKLTLAEGVTMNEKYLKVLSTVPINTKVIQCSDNTLTNNYSYICDIL